ncbi:hypothetical protein AAIB42_06385 [Streptococcus ruminicola]|uniref:hypothetical protein n=1 Tax=Streptococcus ruminicola TaxID=2686210 RepID=UPI003F614EE2
MEFELMLSNASVLFSEDVHVENADFEFSDVKVQFGQGNMQEVCSISSVLMSM